MGDRMTKWLSYLRWIAVVITALAIELDVRQSLVSGLCMLSGGSLGAYVMNVWWFNILKRERALYTKQIRAQDERHAMFVLSTGKELLHYKQDADEQMLNVLRVLYPHHLGHVKTFQEAMEIIFISKLANVPKAKA